MVEHTTITIKKDLQKDLMLFKIKSNAKSLDQVIRQAIEKLKGELNGSGHPDASNSQENLKNEEMD